MSSIVLVKLLKRSTNYNGERTAVKATSKQFKMRKIYTTREVNCFSGELKFSEFSLSYKTLLLTGYIVGVESNILK